jgi:allophanate hydrolase subunit 2
VLARGDALSIGIPSDGASARTREPLEAERGLASVVAPVRVVPGPDRARFEGGIDALLSTTWRLSARRDRVGARLEGGRIRRIDHGASESMPMVRGAIQVPPSGEPIVLGPDHPTTGGYPVVAVVLAADVDAFYARPVGATIAFTLARV